MEHKRKCNVCGKVFCYTDEDLKKNASNAGMGALSALGSLASTLGGGTIFHTHHLQGQADRYTDKIVDYNQCPYCHSRNLSVFTGNIKEDTKVAKTVNINTSASTEALLKRVFLFLEDGEWETADAYCEACLDKEPESAEAYLGKLMAELHVNVQGELKNQPNPFDTNGNYRKAIRYADDELRNMLIGYIEHINNRNEDARKDKILCDAKSKMTCVAISNYDEASSLLASIPGWKDADELKSICLLKIAELNEEEARLAEIKLQKAEEETELAQIKAKKNKKIAAIVTPIIAVLIVAAAIICNTLEKKKEEAARLEAYNAAIALMDAGQYTEAIAALNELGNYADAVEQIQIAEKKHEEAKMEAAYTQAKLFLEIGYEEYEDKAYSLLRELGDYKDAKTLLESFKYVCLASNKIQYKYDSSGSLIEVDYGSYSYYYEYENGRIIWKGTSKSDWGATTYTYYSDGTLKSTVDGVSRGSDGAVTTQTVHYNEDGYPETIVYARDNKPNEHEIWNLSYTISDSGSITALVCSIQDYGKTKAVTESFDFSDHDGFISIEIAHVDSSLASPVRLTFTNADKTYTEIRWIEHVEGFNSIFMRKDSEITTDYDSDGKMITETTVYPTSKRQITKHYTYDDQGNLLEELSSAKENTDGKRYVTTYTYGYIYCPDAA